MNHIICSIIIPYYNVPTELVNRCLNSILNQNWGNTRYEVIFINDGSLIPIDESTKKLFQLFPLFTLIEQENKGPGIARNKGIQFSNGKYLLFLDSDDYWHFNTFHFLLPYIIKEKYDVIKFSTQGFAPLSKHHTFETQTGCEYMAKNNLIKGVWSYCYKTEFIKKHHIFMPNFHNAEDDVFLYYVFYHASKCLFTNTPLYFYDREQNNSLTKNNITKKAHYILQCLKELSLFNIEQIEKGINITQQKALNRAFYTIIIDYIYKICTSTLSSFEKKVHINALNQITTIKPLPNIKISFKYTMFRICSFNYYLLQTLSKIINYIYKIQCKKY